MTALAPTEVPAPRTHGLCEDDSVLGAPFYVMADMPGTSYRHAAQLEPLGPRRTRLISERMIDTLVQLHEVDPAAVGLADFGRPQGFLGRQVRRWKQQLDASHSRDLPALDELHRRLEARVEQASRAGDPTTGIVHGDYRLDNLLIDGDHERGDHVTAILDWEMATVGDTLTDLALMVVYNRLATVVPHLVADASLAPGFLGEHELLERYAAGRGRELAELGFHLALASFKLVGILEGIHYRHLHGQTVGAGFEHVGQAVEPLLQAGLEALPPS
jgi:aminoglycoside phosphotransferase (APT) family kinase protein